MSCAGQESCRALHISAPELGQVTLDQLEVMVHSDAGLRPVFVRDQVLTLPVTVGVSLPELASNPQQRVSLYLHATYGATTSLAANVDPISGGTTEPREVTLQVACTGPSCPSPGQREQAAMAFDVGSRKLILFGGQRDNGVALADTWEWDGISWRDVTTRARPGARAGHAMAYDPQRGRVILFGGDEAPGSGASALLADTWEYLGAGVWQQLPGPGPSPRSHAAMDTAPIGTFDPAELGVLLFGGESATGELLGDTWVWRGAQARWAQVAKSDLDPSCRTGAALSLVRWPEGRSEAILLGGRTGSSALGQPTYDDYVWRWDGTAWWHALVANPPQVLHRSQHQMVRTGDGDGTQLLLTGGETDGAVRQDAFVLDLNVRLFVPQLGAGPAARSGAAAAFDQLRGEVVLLGGRGAGGNLSDMWIFQQAQGWSPRR